jgi:hypothetical protein
MKFFQDANNISTPAGARGRHDYTILHGPM